MKVRITRSVIGLWYYHLVGECFIVTLHENDRIYKTIYNGNIKAIFKHHCIDVKEERSKKLNRILNDTK